MVSDESSHISCDSPFLTFSLHSHCRESVSWNIHGEDYSGAMHTEWMLLLWCVKLSSFLKDCQAENSHKKKHSLEGCSLDWHQCLNMHGEPEIFLLVSSNKTVFPDKSCKSVDMGWVRCLQCREQRSPELLKPASMCMPLVAVFTLQFFRAGVFSCHARHTGRLEPIIGTKLNFT